MASLGELTAGIAHEIQNPLNFVNNFSEVNIELLEEMEGELKRGEIEEALDISSNIKQNLDKDRLPRQARRRHCKRHAAAQPGQQRAKGAYVDVNVLADEYLRLAYHGLRAKDKTFNSELVTNLAGKLPLVPMIPQDIGRVLINLFNNAFYATQHKQKTAGANYKPTLEMTTALVDGFVEIKVKDKQYVRRIAGPRCG